MDNGLKMHGSNLLCTSSRIPTFFQRLASLPPAARLEDFHGERRVASGGVSPPAPGSNTVSRAPRPDPGPVPGPLEGQRRRLQTQPPLLSLAYPGTEAADDEDSSVAASTPAPIRPTERRGRTPDTPSLGTAPGQVATLAPEPAAPRRRPRGRLLVRCCQHGLLRPLRALTWDWLRGQMVCRPGQACPPPVLPPRSARGI